QSVLPAPLPDWTGLHAKHRRRYRPRQVADRTWLTRGARLRQSVRVKLTRISLLPSAVCREFFCTRRALRLKTQRRGAVVSSDAVAPPRAFGSGSERYASRPSANLTSGELRGWHAPCAGLSALARSGKCKQGLKTAGSA